MILAKCPKCFCRLTSTDKVYCILQKASEECLLGHPAVWYTWIVVLMCVL